MALIKDIVKEDSYRAIYKALREVGFNRSSSNSLVDDYICASIIEAVNPALPLSMLIIAASPSGSAASKVNKFNRESLWFFGGIKTALSSFL